MFTPYFLIISGLSYPWTYLSLITGLLQGDIAYTDMYSDD